MPDCALYIFKPSDESLNNLFSACQTISQNQPTADLRVEGLRLDDTSEADVFTPSRNTHTLILESCTLPSKFATMYLIKLPCATH